MGPLSLKECARMRTNAMERNRQLGIAWKAVTNVVSIVVVILHGCVAHLDFVQAQVNMSGISAG